MSDRIDVPLERLRDRRSKRVVFLSHCLLNENTRYLGGAGRSGCVREIVEECIDRGIGMVQMPCPEQEAWGGVLKRRLLRLYGTARDERTARALDALLTPIALRYTRAIYRRIARAVAAQIDDYVASGLTVTSVVAIDGSPSCGLNKTVDVSCAVRAMAAIAPEQLSVDQLNALVRRCVVEGRGIFVDELQSALRRRGVNVPFVAHDLLAELDGNASTVVLEPRAAAGGHVR